MKIKEYWLKFRKKIDILADRQWLRGGGGATPLIISKYAIKVVWNWLLWGSTITDYFELTFWRKSIKEKRLFLTWRSHKKFIFEVDEPAKLKALSDKSLMYSRLKRFVGRAQLGSNKCAFDEFVGFVGTAPRFLYKPNNGSCGKGILKYDATGKNLEALFQEIRSMPSGILDQLIVQHSRMAEVNPTSVNTIRIMTFRTYGNLYYTGAAFRIGTTGYVDNYDAGGIVVSIDIKSGRSRGPGENNMGERFEKHPVTGVDLRDIVIPNWNQLLDLVYEMASDYEINYVAWDIAIGQNEVWLVEANPHGMINAIQVGGAGGKKELYKRLEKEWRSHPYKNEGQILKRVYC